MKASIRLASFIAVFALTPAVAFADPTELEVSVFCPAITGTTNVLANYGSYVGGKGEEIMGPTGRKIIYFKSDNLPSGVPAKLTNYRPQEADYDSTNGRVACSYVSYRDGEPRFSVSYTLTNGIGGIVTDRSVSHVVFRLPLGFAA